MHTKLFSNDITLQCTKCGTGCCAKTRKVLCIKNNTAVHVKQCDPDLTPSSSEECDKQICTEGKKAQY